MKHLPCFILLFLPILAPARPVAGEFSGFHGFNNPWQARPGHQLEEILQSRSIELPYNAREHVAAVSCSLPQTLKSFLALGTSDQKPSTTTRPPHVSLLSQPATNLADIFKVIDSAPTGRKIMAQFLPKYGYQFKIKQITPKIQKLLRNQRPIAVYQPSKQILYFDKSRQIGRVAFILLHEIVHALDKEGNRAFHVIGERNRQFQLAATKVINKAARLQRKLASQLGPADFAVNDIMGLLRQRREIEQMTQIRSFKTERLAYDASYQVWQELAKQFPRYYRKRRKGPSLKPVSLSDERMIEVMHFNPKYISNFKVGRCRVVTP